jgi:hypothetical protein
MRKKTAFIFLLLANMVLLAHAVIPHHHHADVPTEVAVNCNNQEEHSHHENLPICNDDHEHGETTACEFTEGILTPNIHNRLNVPSEQVSFDILFFTLFVSNYSTIISCIDFPIEEIGSIPLHSRFLISSQGLRAPPVC